MSDANENPYDMHNIEHQKVMIERGKRYSKMIDWVDHCLMGFFKNLIHVFMCIGLFGFIFAIITIAQDSTRANKIDPYEIKVAQETSAIMDLM